MAVEDDVTLTHKIRNPKDVSQWIEDWTATVHKDENDNITYKIQPSENWKIPVNQIIDSDSGMKVVDTENEIYDFQNNEIPYENKLAIFKDHNTIISSPTTFNYSNGSINKFLNEKGEWIQLKSDSGIKITNNNNIFTIEHENSIEPTSNSGIGITLTPYGESPNSNQDYLMLQYPRLWYDAQGHIKTMSSNTEYIKFNASGITDSIHYDKNIEGISTDITANTPAEDIADLENFNIEEYNGSWKLKLPSSVITTISKEPVSQQLQVTVNIDCQKPPSSS